MRKKILAANWKMNLLKKQAVNFIEDFLKDENSNLIKGEIVIFPAFPYIDSLSKQCAGSGLKIGAQNIASFKSGAYTGEVSAEMLKDSGAEYVLIGHSERRSLFHEKSEDLIQKIQQAITNNLKVIFCFGEQKDEREKSVHFDIVAEQLKSVLSNFEGEEVADFVLAYEPVWAIGTGLTASPAQAGEMHTFIRKWLMQTYGNAVSENVSILYGGSCKPDNAESLFSQKDVDGGLIGGASLKAESFIALKNILFQKKEA
ncbi:MAG: triose-phosphate isomerase [Chitinophagaceae bacterium]|nr:MAG: triose-phosphate isomerase [Chitinophagaceae bacterium]